MNEEKVKVKKKKEKFKAKNWYSNRYQIISVQRNILFLFALVSTISMCISVILVRHIITSKSLEPYLVEIEEKSGIATVVTHSTTKTLTKQQAVIDHFMNRYILASSGYDPRTYKDDRNLIRAFSSRKVYREFTSRVDFKKLGSGSKIKVKIRSINPKNPSTYAQIRILKEIQSKGNPEVSQNELITMHFKSESDVTLSKKDRLINPLGFQVTHYSVIRENF